MDNRNIVTTESQRKKHPRATITGDGSGAYFRRPKGPYSPESTQLMGLMALLVSTGILLFLSGITVTSSVISLVCFAPVIIITSPIWIPTTVLLFFVGVVVLSLSGLGLAVAAAVSWLPRYL